MDKMLVTRSKRNELEAVMKFFDQKISIKSRDHFYDDIKINLGEIIVT